MLTDAPSLWRELAALKLIDNHLTLPFYISFAAQPATGNSTVTFPQSEVNELALCRCWLLSAGLGSGARGYGCSWGKSYLPRDASHRLGNGGTVLGAGSATLLLVTLDATHVHPLDNVAVFASVSAPLHLLAVFLTCVEMDTPTSDLTVLWVSDLNALHYQYLVNCLTWSLSDHNIFLCLAVISMGLSLKVQCFPSTYQCTLVTLSNPGMISN